MARDQKDHAQDALDRMRHADEQAIGCYLTVKMIAALSVTVFGQMWNEDRPAADEGGAS